MIDFGEVIAAADAVVNDYNGYEKTRPMQERIDRWYEVRQKAMAEGAGFEQKEHAELEEYRRKYSLAVERSLGLEEKISGAILEREYLRKKNEKLAVQIQQLERERDAAEAACVQARRERDAEKATVAVLSTERGMPGHITPGRPDPDSVPRRLYDELDRHARAMGEQYRNAITELCAALRSMTALVRALRRREL